MLHDPKIRIVVVDDHASFRAGVVDELGREPDMVVLGEGADASSAIDVVQALRPDVVVLDMNMPGGGLAVVARLANTCPEAILLLFTVVADPDQIEAAMRMGAGGYLRKGATMSELMDAIRAVYRGEALDMAGPLQ
ncbi:response regulator [Alsobacter sp. R-9]